MTTRVGSLPQRFHSPPQQFIPPAAAARRRAAHTNLMRNPFNRILRQTTRPATVHCTHRLYTGQHLPVSSPLSTSGPQSAGSMSPPACTTTPCYGHGREPLLLHLPIPPEPLLCPRGTRTAHARMRRMDAMHLLSYGCDQCTYATLYSDGPFFRSSPASFSLTIRSATGID